jgi:tetratricopeptide (TPR) repeat protein
MLQLVKMNRFKKYVLTLLVLSVSGSFHGQYSIQRLQRDLLSTKDDSSKVRILLDLSDQWNNQGENDKSLIYAQQALHLAENLKAKIGRSRANTQVGIVYLELGNYEKALKHYLIALKISEDIKDKQGVAYLYNNIGNVYREQGNHKKALAYFLRSLIKCEELQDQRGISKASFGAGIVNRLSGNYNKALDYYFKSMKIDEKLGNTSGVAHTYTSIGIVYSITGRFEKALDYYSKSLQVALQTGDRKEIALCKINLGCTFLDRGEYTKAEVMLQEALGLFKSIGHKNGVKEVYQSLAALYEKKTDFLNALKYQKIVGDLKDELISESSTKQMLTLNARYQSEKKINENKSLRQKNKIQALTISNGRFTLIAVALFFLIVIAFVYLAVRQNKLKEEQTHRLFEQKLLRTQMNPHFIFNSLTSIESFIYEHDPKTAGIYLSRFSRLMRLILENSTSELISLDKEVEMLNYYLSLQKMRLDDQLDYAIDVQDQLASEDVLLPPMLLQPFLENAIEHGLRGGDSRGEVLIFFSISEGELSIVITDNGIGIEKATQEKADYTKHKSLAVKITQERLELLNKARRKKLNFSIRDRSKEGQEVSGTEVKFSIPLTLK